MYLQSEAKCPYCHQLLPKPPQRKGKCCHRGQVYYVRTRPATRDKVIVTAQEVEAIEAEWKSWYEEKRRKKLEEQLRSLPRNANPWERLRLKALLACLEKKFDKAWSLFNKARLKAASNRCFGIYSNITLDMAEQLEAEGRLRQALLMLCEVCYYDMNGASNFPGSDWPVWNPETAFLAPGVISMIRDCVEALKLEKEEFQRSVLKHLKQIENTMRPPLSAEAVLPAQLEVAFSDNDLEQIKLPKKQEDETWRGS